MDTLGSVNNTYVDGEGYVFIDRVKVGRRVRVKGGYAIEFFDKDKRRSARRGSRRVHVLWADFVTLITSEMEG